MQTTCPQCKTTFPVNLAQLRAGSGTVQCGKCLSNFNALQALYESDSPKDETADLSSPPLIPLLQEESEPVAEDKPEESTLSEELEESTLSEELEESTLSEELEESALSEELKEPALSEELQEPPLPEKIEELPPTPEIKEPATLAPWDAEKNTINWLQQFLWLLVVIPTLLLLAGQFYLNEAKHNFPDPTARAAFEVVCGQLNKIAKEGCELPPIRKISSIDVVDRSFQTLKDQLLLKITLVNHSTHDQPLPKLKLTLSNIRDEAIAQRLFEPHEYLLDSDMPKIMTVDSPIELQLAIKPLEEKVSAFSFELL